MLHYLLCHFSADSSISYSTASTNLTMESSLIHNERSRSPPPSYSPTRGQGYYRHWKSTSHSQMVSSRMSTHSAPLWTLESWFSIKLIQLLMGMTATLILY